MKMLVITLLLFSLSFVAIASEDSHTAEAKKITGAFFEELKDELGKALKSGGPVTAISVCKSIAPDIAEKHSKSTGWDVARTSRKLRNPSNAPDAWETKVLLDFEERRATGESASTLVYSEVVEKDGESYFRFMKGIVMPSLEKMPCLKCHGETIEPETAAILDELYPEDKARGYKAGQVRGAFTLKKKL